MNAIINIETKDVALDQLRAHPANPRRGNVDAIRESIDENGFYGRIVVQKSTGYILAGNHRYLAAKEAGLDVLPVDYVDVDDERAMRILLADNRTNDLAVYDNEALAEMLEHLASTDTGLLGTGYNEAALADMLAAIADPSSDDWLDAFGAVPEGEKAPFQQMTFTVHDSQMERIKEALAIAKGEGGDFEDSPNDNSNGNALWFICDRYLVEYA